VGNSSVVGRPGNLANAESYALGSDGAIIKEEMMLKKNGAKTMTGEPNQEQQRDMITNLKVLLAEESILYTKLRNYHWNVTGVNFYSLHHSFV
jgi:hypothetical protein